MRFVDEAEILLASGKGGRGCVAFRREKYVPKGGPDGGDGGDGGSIVLVADPGMGSLLDFRHKRVIRAPNGAPGEGSNKHGKNGGDVRVRLPVGTLVRDAVSGELLADLVKPGQEQVILRGGKGGRGNSWFATATHQAPTYAQPGLPGAEAKVRLVLKLLADVGLLGFPNAGKSTLISRISAARPKVADYPFTTLVPNLGVVRWGGDKTFVVADIPGLIEGASGGSGLGIRFLKHVERTRLLLHLIDAADGKDPLDKYDILRRELRRFDPELADRPEQVVLTKMDVTEAREAAPGVLRRFSDRGIEAWTLSAVTGAGVKDLVNRVGRRVEALRSGEEETKGEEVDE